MNRTTQADEAQIQRTYLQLTFLGLLLHIIQTVIFLWLGYMIPAIYNGASVLFYTLMLYVTRRQRYRITVACIHIETCLFALFCVISCGWQTGVPLFLLAISSLVYFCPFERKFIPYLFSLSELAIFLLLRVYTSFYEPIYSRIPEFAEMLYYIFNALACFYIILFAAYSSNISATVTNIRLRYENMDLSTLANLDYLTGLSSRRAFLQRIKELPLETTVIASIGDLDDFKQINDTYGHSCGDFVLRTVGQILCTGCGAQAIPCRWGGEEFVILFYGCSLSDAVSRLEKLRTTVSSHVFEYEEQIMNITITFGAYSGVLGKDVVPLIGEADKYLYRGKKHGKNCVLSPLREGTRLD